MPEPSDFRRGRHVVYHLKAHLVFVPKYRRSLISTRVCAVLRAAWETVCQDFECELVEANFEPDHVHLLFVLGRTVSIADAIGTVKKPSSSWANERRKSPTAFAWQNGYATFSAAQSNLDDVREYIRSQAEHRKRQSFQDELREWLTRYEEKFDERYLWD